MKRVAIISACLSNDYGYLIKCLNSVRTNEHLISFYIFDNGPFNIGWSIGVNSSLKSAYDQDNEYFLVLHADSELYADCLDTLIREYEEEKVFSLLSATPETDFQRGKKFITDTPSSACFLLDRKTYKEIGAFDESFIPYAQGLELEDYLMRIYAKGDRAGRANHAVFKHNQHPADELWLERNGFRHAQNKSRFISKWKVDPSQASWREDKFTIDRENS